MSDREEFIADFEPDNRPPDPQQHHLQRAGDENCERATVFERAKMVSKSGAATSVSVSAKFRNMAFSTGEEYS